MTTLLPTRPSPTPAPSRRTPRWETPAATLLIVGTAVAYLVNLSASGWGNSFYAAAVQAGSQSWTAFFFGSSDAANSITVDKPPMSLWVMGLSVRLFGLNSWSVLAPQVIVGAASVALLWRTVRRHAGPAAGLLAGLTLALTPVAALMFRFDNPDALLVLLMIVAVWAALRAVDDGRTRWLVLAGAAVGAGFLTKQLQVMLVVPPIALTYLLAGPVSLPRRVVQSVAALGAAAVTAGWWIAVVELWPASSRPWIGGSQNNSILELTLGYNGLGRLNGEETGSVVPGGGGGGGQWGETGILRLFEPAQGGQIAWLIPAALILGLAALVLRGRAPRTDGLRAGVVLWGLWLVVTGLTFSFMAGIFHAYYTVALAPAVAALVGTGAVVVWRRRDRIASRLVLAAAVIATVATAWILLSRSADFVPWLRFVVVGAAVVAVVGLLVPRLTRGRLAAATVMAALIAGLAGPAAYTVHTIATPHTGSIVSAGPSVEGERGGMGGPGDGRGRGDGQAAGRFPGAPTGGVPAGGPPPGAPASDGAPGGGAGGLLTGSTPGAELTALLEQDAGNYTWVAATVGSNAASGYQLATEDPVMPIGGFNGSDPSPTLEQFQQYVAERRIHYFLAGGQGGRSSGPAAEIAAWVEATFTAQTVDGVQMYDLTA
ncbi:glycosyltransferase family 39 protein [Rhodococcoides corynebacterioides]|uniref:Glycosyltransferase family 39 protein n=1 Tax=Rhodococcoides corynebacterioides TaxID=53972 RepID=A0ABS7P2B0_9NOCA|nr:glycosyltransferase family 39 protein [Rhodococcus corynebacterioides]MBY6365814.1 glycosyltransferase family 39 protein [Rhodococcus corynebacterioides]MBY6408237.1 glycosyltransferase family 39 protein [Rhodococcus corynebacterioides]